MVTTAMGEDGQPLTQMPAYRRRSLWRRLDQIAKCSYAEG